MKDYILGCLVTTVIFLIIGYMALEHLKDVVVKTTYKLCEEAYFDGQRDAIQGNVRIKLNSDSVYMWTKSPWDDGMKPSFVPTRIDTKKSK